MARDILCIPASETLVERVFSTARTVCNYKRNRLAPETIRAIMLVYYRQKIERERQFEHYSVTDIIDSTNMTEEEIGLEYNAMVETIQDKMAIQYIPDRSPNRQNTHNWTQRNEERVAFIQSRRELHSLQRVQPLQNQRQSQAITSTFNDYEHEFDDDIIGVPLSQNDGDYQLPSLTRPASIAKRPRNNNGAQIIQRDVTYLYNEWRMSTSGALSPHILPFTFNIIYLYN
jgi:hypothetical protein